MKLTKFDDPYYKYVSSGPSALSDRELAYIVTGGWLEGDIVDVRNSPLPYLQEMTKATAKQAIKFQAALELARRTKPLPERKKIRCSKDAFDLLKDMIGDLPHEEFWIISLNRNNLVLGMKKISSGGINGTVADRRIIAKSLIEIGASAFICAHNHPSGNLQPSDADIKLHRVLKESMQLLDIALLDSLIISYDAYLSLTDDNLL